MAIYLYWQKIAKNFQTKEISIADALRQSVGYVVFFVFLILAVRYQSFLLDHEEFGDESETIMTAKMLVSGRSLYSEIFNHHGPLVFLPGYILEKFGGFGIQGHRVLISLFQLIAFFCIYFSPLLKNHEIKKIYTIIVSTIVLVYFSDIRAHMYLYQVLGGLCLTIILSQYTLPSIVCPDSLNNKRIITGNLATSFLPFISITYIPATFLIFIASLKRNHFTTAFKWIAIGFMLNIIFLSYIGSIPGYLAFHIYVNQKILPTIRGSQHPLALMLTAFTGATIDYAQFFVFLPVALSVVMLAFYEKKIPWRSLFVGIGTGSLLIRGYSYHGIPYFYSAIALPLVFFSRPVKVSNQSFVVIFLLIFVCLIKVSVYTNRDQEKFRTSKLPKETEFSRLVKILTSKEDRIIAYSFRNYDYITSDRLPASGNFFYLVPQAKYNESPKFGIKIDSCKDIEEYRPKIMLIDKWTMEELFPWDTFAGCIDQILEKHYQQLPDRPYYIRKDIFADLPKSDNTIYQGAVSPQLSATLPLSIAMTPEHQKSDLSLKKISIKFATFIRNNPGTAQLRLNSPDGHIFTQSFSLPELEDNQYHTFDLDSKFYTSGEIVSITGEGVSTYESHHPELGKNTCIIYHYSNGKIRGTSGCPFFW